MKKDLAAWLSYIESLHPKSIAMGLERVRLVSQRMQINPQFKIITVAGTNGKGSTCAMLEQIYNEAGYQVGCYTSPHLLRYNERVRINGSEVSDDALCTAFAAVEHARIGDMEHLHNATPIQLTYFEVGTLAAMWHFMRSSVDVAILEVGLGGRLDAVNAFEPDCAIVTTVDLDHVEFLGDTREKIGFEKAGVFRSLVPAICGDMNPPASLIEHAKKIHADLKCIGRDFKYEITAEGWQYFTKNHIKYRLPLPSLTGAYQINNACCALTAIESLQSSLPVSANAIVKGMLNVTLAGRFQILTQQLKTTILDVAHNPHAANALVENLRAMNDKKGLTYAVFAMLADKDIQGVIKGVKDQIDIWYVANIKNIRGAQATDLAKLITEITPNTVVKIFENPAIAYQHAYIDSGENDKIVVFGSFFTVANVMASINRDLAQ